MTDSIDSDTEDACPISSHPFGANGAHAECIEEDIEKLLKLGLIQKSHSD